MKDSDGVFRENHEITFRLKSTKAFETTGDATIEYSISAYLSTRARTCNWGEHNNIVDKSHGECQMCSYTT